MSDVQNILLKFTAFQDFTPQEISIISRYVSVERFVKEQVLMKKGEVGRSLSIILNGSVRVIDENIVITTRSAGDLLGEIALIRSSLRTADVVAISDGEIAVMAFDTVARFKQEHPTIALKLMIMLAEQFILEIQILFLI